MLILQSAGRIRTKTTMTETPTSPCQGFFINFHRIKVHAIIYCLYIQIAIMFCSLTKVPNSLYHYMKTEKTLRLYAFFA